MMRSPTLWAACFASTIVLVTRIFWIELWASGWIFIALPITGLVGIGTSLWVGIACLITLGNRIGKRQRLQVSSFIAIAILSLGLVATSAIDPRVVDFNRYRSPRETIVTQVIASQIQPDARGFLPQSAEQFSRSRQIRVARQDEVLTIEFMRYTTGWGDGAASYVYRSDDQDISIHLEDYISQRQPDEPPFRRVEKITEHWFWQEESW